MGIKCAMAAYCLGLVMAGPAPGYAQDNPDEVATQRTPEDRADAPDAADPSDRDTSLVDPDFFHEPTDDDDQIHEQDTVVRNPKLAKARIGAKASQLDSEDMVDDADNDPGDNSRPSDRRAKKDPPPPPKKDTPDKKPPAKDNSKRPAGCVDVTTEARFAGVGYDHLVTLKSDCKKPVKCQVRTNVTAEPTPVVLAPAAEETVVTWRGSPARAFTPDVTCK